ncbi:MAG: electron transport complex subunit RsxD [Gammaproteobacteria bacterium]
MTFFTPSSPHIQRPESVTTVMLRVIYALTPGIAAYVWYFGWGIVINILLACIVALICESSVLTLRRKPVLPFLTDGSAIVTAMLLALALPPLSPWWLVTIGVAFAIIIAKHLYGGLGYNPFNPAMIGYVVLLVSFPLEMTNWIAPQIHHEFDLGFLDSVIFVLTNQLPANISFDALSEATPLDALKTNIGLGNTVEEIRAQLGMSAEISELLSITPIFGKIGGIGWEWVSGGFLLGGLWLLYKRVIQWQIPISMLGALSLISLIFFIINPDQYASPIFHLFSGAAILGAFFIATDPVTAATSPPARIIYGAGIGVLTYVIRTWGGYPDGIAFAVLLMNMTSPTLDYYFRPRVFGHDRREE